MNILITGGLGYVGGRLSEYFSKNEHYKVFALSRSKTIENKQINVLSNHAVLNENALKGIQIDALIHLAATNEIECSREPIKCNEVNINGTIEWLQWAKENNVGQFIYFSTVHVYDRPLKGSYDENSKCDPLHPYSISHKTAEDYCNWYRLDHGLNTKIVRLSNSFGYPAYTSANRWTLLINDLCKQIVENNSIQLYSNIKQKRDFIPLSSVCSAIEQLITNESNESIFNLSNSRSKSLEEVALWVKNIAEKWSNRKIDFNYDPKKNKESEKLSISNDRLRSLGWEPDWSKADEEIIKTLEFFSKQSKQ